MFIHKDKEFDIIVWGNYYRTEYPLVSTRMDMMGICGLFLLLELHFWVWEYL
jgi:hypothetical protein